MRDARVRRAFSVAINRKDINNVVFYGLAKPSANTLIEASPLFDPAYRDAFAQFDPKLANKLLDEAGLAKRDWDGVRLLPDGRRAEITIEGTGEKAEETDSVELIVDNFRDIGIRLFYRSAQRELFRRRVLIGETVSRSGTVVDNGLAGPDTEPDAFAPTNRGQYQWPRFGQFIETSGRMGDAIDMPDVQELATLYKAWQKSETRAEREAIWRKMLRLHAEQVYSIGVVNHTLQPIIASRRLRNLPDSAWYSFEPAPSSACTGRTPSGSPTATAGADPEMLFRYIFRRILLMVPTLLITSALIFTVMELPPGDFFETYQAEMQAQGERADMSRVEFLKKEYHFDKRQWNATSTGSSTSCAGDFGYSFEYQMPVRDVIGQAAADDPDLDADDPLHLGHRLSDRHLFGDAPVQLGRLWPHLPGAARHRHAAFPAGAGGDVFRQRLVRALDRRADGARISQPALQLGQVRLDPQAYLAAGRGDRPDRDRRHDPGRARQTCSTSSRSNMS